MKPAGVKRDKEIAVLREEESPWDYCQPVKDGRCKPWDKTDDCCSVCSLPDATPYLPRSTDIACAMELWEEIKEAKLMPAIKAIWIEEGELGYRVSCEGGHFMYETWDMPDAISGAWLKWKEGE